MHDFRSVTQLPVPNVCASDGCKQQPWHIFLWENLFRGDLEVQTPSVSLASYTGRQGWDISLFQLVPAACFCWAEAHDVFFLLVPTLFWKTAAAATTTKRMLCYCNILEDCTYRNHLKLNILEIIKYTGEYLMWQSVCSNELPMAFPINK